MSALTEWAGIFALGLCAMAVLCGLLWAAAIFGVL